MPKFKLKDKYVSVSRDFIDNFMPKAHGEYVKVYLCGLAAADAGDEIDDEAIAEKLQILVTDVEKAWQYWQEKKLVTVNGDEIVFGERSASAAPLPADKPPHVTSRDISAALKVNPAMKETIEAVEKMLGKPLTPREIKCVYNFMDWYGMDSTVVLMLIEYCVSREKRNFAYIAKVAEEWHKEGVNSFERAEAVVRRANEEKKFHGQCKKMFGLDRGFTASELKYLNSWKSEMGFSPEMVYQAYEITIKNTGKLAFAYMNKILSNWHQKGIATIEQIKEKDTKPAKAEHLDIDEQELIEMRRRLGKR